MKVLHVSPDSAVRPIGGIGVHVDELARLQRSDGDEVEVVVVGGRGRQGGPDERGLTLAQKLRVRQAQLGPGAVRTRPDVVHAHGYRTGFAAKELAVRFGCPLVLTFHTVPLAGRGVLVDPEVYSIERELAERADGVLFVSESVREVVSRSGWHITPNQAVFRPAVTPLGVGEARGSYRRPDLLCLGRLAEDKGADVLVESAQRLGERAPRIVFAGDGPLSTCLQERAAEFPEERAPRFLGPLDRRSAWELLRKSRCVAMPSRWEADGLVFREALAAGCGLLVSSVGGLADQLRMLPSRGEGRVVEFQHECGPAGIDRALESAAKLINDHVRGFEPLQLFGEQAFMENVRRVYGEAVG